MKRLVASLAAAGAAAVLIAPVGLLGPVFAAADPGSDVSTASAVAECKNGDLLATYKSRGTAAGSSYGVIRLTNVSGSSCFTTGFGGLSYVGHGDGTQIGPAAGRRHKKAAHRVVLAPGDRVRSQVREVNAYAYGDDCRQRDVDGFRVYGPDATRSQFIEHSTIACANTRIHLLSHKPYH